MPGQRRKKRRAPRQPQSAPRPRKQQSGGGCSGGGCSGGGASSPAATPPLSGSAILPVPPGADAVQLALMRGRVLSAPNSANAEVFSDIIPIGARDRLTYTVYVEYGWILPPGEAYTLEFETEVAEDLPNFVVDPNGAIGDIGTAEAGDIAQVTGSAIGSYARVRVKLSNGSVDPNSIVVVSIRVDARLDHQ